MTKTSYHHGNLKKTILDEVLELLNYKSFDEISFRSISRNIGVVSSAPYNHFKDKKHLIREVILLGEKKLFNVIFLEKKKTTVPTEQLLLIAKAYLKFATEEDAEKSVNKIKNSGRSHAHKIQAAVASEQRAKAAGKTSAAGVYRTFINAMKKKTKAKNEDIAVQNF